MKCSSNARLVLTVDVTGRLTSDLEMALKPLRSKIVRAKSYAEARVLTQQVRFDAIVVDDLFEPTRWRDLIDEIRATQLTVPVIVTSAHADERMWVDALFAGAYDVLQIPLDSEEVQRIVLQAVMKCHRNQEAPRPKSHVRHLYRRRTAPI